jgi:predicted AlkP superfamily pyrophosphatase or phosphodiesterase
LGHKYGPRSKEVLDAVRYVDHVVNRVLLSMETIKDPAQLLLFSDHGMTPVTTSIDIESKLAKLEAKPLIDFFYYLNSTVASFFFISERGRVEVTRLLDGLEHGRVLSQQDWTELGGPPPLSYGHTHFALDEGTAIFPDFYGRRLRPKGLHGYAFPSYDRPILITSPPLRGNTPTTVRFEDLAPTIASLLSLTPEASWEGRTLL